jgi:hypothetical protein
MHPILPFLGCRRLLRWTDQGDHLRALIRLLTVSVLTPPHQSPFRIKASGAAPERSSSPCPWRPAPQPNHRDPAVSMRSPGHALAGLARPATLVPARGCVRSHGLQHADLVTDERAPRLGGHACTRSRQRRWRQPRRSTAAHGGPAGSVAHQHSWLTTNAVDALTPPAVWSGP